MNIEEVTLRCPFCKVEYNVIDGHDCDELVDHTLMRGGEKKKKRQIVKEKKNV